MTIKHEETELLKNQISSIQTLKMLYNTLTTLAITALLSFTTTVQAGAEPIRLLVESNYPEVNNTGLVFKEETPAGTSYVFFGNPSNATLLDWDGSDIYTSSLSAITEYLNVDSEFVIATNTTRSDKQLYFDDEYLTVDENDEGFYACLHAGDPLNYSEGQYELMYYPDGQSRDGCVDVKLYRIAGV
ncbi:unnamed protein product [Ambrosiozyma monospora]|uniref:Unnamed protein product n=1 Tax=Ambrosiozyma monospora TaxID=43982 RepID=A0ACB5TIY6_AMBMO|nr:unnamed protein product [Ambrosiozyma monospora]